MKGIGRSSVVAGSIVFVLRLWVTPPAHASLVEVPVFGPEPFVRDTGAPQSAVRDFTVPIAAQSYVLQVQNGSVDQADLIASAVIKVNGTTIFKQNDFNQHTYYLESPVSLGIQNQLDIQLNSIPSSYVTITVVGYYPLEDMDDDGDGLTENEGDCDDADAAVHPGAAETCDGVDNDCDGAVDEDLASTFHLDADGDTHGDPTQAIDACTQPAGYVASATDCNDADAAIYPGAAEVCDGTDNDCDVDTLDGVGETPPSNTIQAGVCAGTLQACSAGSWVDDYAGVTGYEIDEATCDALDNDCDDLLDEGLTATFFQDADGDGYGLSTVTTEACTVPAGFADLAGDCDDGDALVSPDAEEVCSNGLDDNCSGTSDEGCSAVEPLPAGSFGKQYEDLVPADATVDAYDPDRFSVVTGLVQDRDGLPLAGVTVTIHALPRYGSVLTDVDGRFSLPLDGGTTFTMVYEKAGLLTSHRQVYVPWNDIAIAETLQMLTMDPLATPVTFDGDPQTVVTHASTSVADEFGSRSTTLVFTGDNRAWVTNPDGSEVEVSTITARATEYDTPESMPAKLPPTSAYTYCTELSVDEGENVRFDQPVTMYVDNFLGFDVGEIVPVGYYDRERAVWVPSDNGVVVKLLDTDSDGVVDALDSTGDDLADDLDGDSVFTDEVIGLENSVLYAVNSTYWRAEVTHFTPWDHNWPYGPPVGAIPPNPVAPASAQPQATPPLASQTNPTTCMNSFVEPLARAFHEDIPIPGTDVALHYSSSRVPGRKTLITVPASGETIPPNLQSILVKVEVAGRQLSASLAAAPNQKAELAWDGLDVFGRSVLGATKARVRTGFVYEAVYYSALDDFARAFARAGDSATGIVSRDLVVIWKDSVISLASPYLGDGTLGKGWTLTPHHQTAPGQSLLFKGDGSLSGSASSMLMQTMAGSGQIGHSGDGALATEAELIYPWGVALGAEGNLWFIELGGSRIRKVDSGGIITTVAGTGQNGYNGDGILATDAHLHYPRGIAVDAAGNLYIAEQYNQRVRKVDPSGIITTVAGTGVQGYNGDGISATEALLSQPLGVAVDAAGNLYIVDGFGYRIRKVDPSGTITTVAGTGISGTGADGIPAVESRIGGLMSVAVDVAGNLYFTAGQRVRKVDPSGIITTVAGMNQMGYNGGLQRRRNSGYFGYPFRPNGCCSGCDRKSVHRRPIQSANSQGRP
ncbi:MAG: MopE-related protein [Deferrisomatales bacterium]|nr:MopE-related protein [Deferrisomatales bacterium]